MAVRSKSIPPILDSRLRVLQRYVKRPVFIERYPQLATTPILIQSPTARSARQGPSEAGREQSFMAEPVQRRELDFEIDVSHLITEDDTPRDSIFSEMQMRLLVESLYRSWTDEAGQPLEFLALSDVGLFATNENPAIVPDVLVSLGVKPPPDIREKKNRSYFIWNYGKPPDLVVEIVSNRVGGELTHKHADYARIGVGYYLVFDPDQQLGERPLRLFERHASTYVELLDPTWMPILKLGVALWKGVYDGLEATWLRWRNQDGSLLATGQEKANQAAAKANQAEAKASQAEHRAEKLAAQLRQLGIEPES